MTGSSADRCARAALAGSENVPAVALASEIGVSSVGRLLRRVGLTTLGNNAAHYGLGLTLGNAEVRLDELTAAYAMFARGGTRVAPRLVTRIDGTVLPPPAVTERIVSERTAFWITDVLADADARAYVFGRGGSLEFPFPVAAKTGTSQSYFDNWVVGYTREVTVGVWVGNFDRTPLRGSSGVTGAGPIFHAVLLAAVERVRGALPIGDTRPIVEAPADVARVELCAMSGKLAGDACPTRVSEWMPAGSDTDRCVWHHASDEGLITVLPEVYGTWAQTAGVLDARTFVAGHTPLPGMTPSTGRDETRAGIAAARTTTTDVARRPGVGDALTITRPLGGAVFLIDPTLRPEFQTLALSARGGAPGGLEWFVDGEPAGRAVPGGAVRWALVRGRHDVSVRDNAGHAASTRIEVR
jgi:penicillin-binding protein 1C